MPTYEKCEDAFKELSEKYNDLKIRYNDLKIINDDIYRELTQLKVDYTRLMIMKKYDRDEFIKDD